MEIKPRSKNIGSLRRNPDKTSGEKTKSAPSPGKSKPPKSDDVTLSKESSEGLGSKRNPRLGGLLGGIADWFSTDPGFAPKPTPDDGFRADPGFAPRPAPDNGFQTDPGFAPKPAPDNGFRPDIGFR